MAGKRWRSTWKRRLLFAATLLATGGGAGIGSWQLKDHPLIQQLIFGVRDGTLDGRESTGAIVAGLSKILDGGATDREGGIYQVQVADLRLDEAEFQEGRTIDIQARVVRFDEDDKATVVWESRAYGQRLAVVGRDDLGAGWADRPFEVEWRPGDRFVVEVWDRKAFWDRRTFQMEPPEDDGVFPLRSGTYRLDAARSHRKPGAADLSKIVLQSRRVGGLDGEATPPQNAQANAEKTLLIR